MRVSVELRINGGLNVEMRVAGDKPMSGNSSGLATIDRLLQTVTALALLLTPVAVAIIGYQATNSSTSKDYVALAVSILNSKDSTKESRQWATTVLNKLSPVPVPSTLKLDLGNNGLNQPLTVYVPVATPPFDCPQKNVLADLQKRRPPSFKTWPKAKTEDEFRERLIQQVAKLTVYSEDVDKIMGMCAHLSDSWQKDHPSSQAPGESRSTSPK